MARVMAVESMGSAEKVVWLVCGAVALLLMVW